MAPREQPCLVPRAIYASALAPAARRSLHTGFAASPMESSGGSGLTNLLIGPLLQCLEAATLGMPLEARALLWRRRRAAAELHPQVWKTRMGRFRTEGAVEAFKNVYQKGAGSPGRRLGAFAAAFRRRFRCRTPAPPRQQVTRGVS